MIIVELNEKAPRIKNKKITLDISKNDLQLLCELVNNKISEIKTKITDEQTEIESVYNKENFNLREVLADLYGLIEGTILKEASLEITYEQFDVLDDIVSENESYLLLQLKKFGRTLLPSEFCRYTNLQRIQSTYMPEYQKAMKKLYPKRIKLHEKFSDYIEESRYNNYLLEDETEITLHIQMKEKENILQVIDNILYKEEKNLLIPLSVLSNDVEISVVELVNTCKKFYKELSKDIFSGCIFQSNIKDYYIMKFAIEHEVID